MNKFFLSTVVLALSLSSGAFANNKEKLKKNILKRDIAREIKKQEKASEDQKHIEQLNRLEYHRPEPMGGSKQH